MGGTVKDPHEVLNGVTEQMNDLLTHMDRNCWLLGSLYNQVVDEALAQNAGYRTAEAYFAEQFEDRVSQSRLASWGAVSKQFPEAVCAQFGVSKLESLITYKNAAKLPSLPADPSRFIVKVPTADGTGTEDKPFPKCTWRQLRAAIAAANGNGAPKSSPVPVPDAARVNELGKSVAKYFGEELRPTVKASMHGQTTVLSFADVPLPELETFLMAMDEGLKAHTDVPAPLAARARTVRGPKVAAKKESRSAPARSRKGRR